MLVYRAPELIDGRWDDAHEHDMQQWDRRSCNVILHTSTTNSDIKLPRPQQITNIKSSRLMTVNYVNQDNKTEALQSSSSNSNVVRL